jgi:hypothetical protein
VRAGLARLTKTDYAPLPTVYDGLFPNGTFLTAPTAKRGDAANPKDATTVEREER